MLNKARKHNNMYEIIAAQGNHTNQSYDSYIDHCRQATYKFRGILFGKNLDSKDK